MKTTTLYTLTLSAVLLAFAFTACVPEDFYQGSRPYSPTEYATLQKALTIRNEPVKFDITLPKHMGGSVQTTDDQIAMLGRVLFYDKNLSKNRTVACASCHHQELAFSDNQAFSKGFDGKLTFRNSLALGATPGFQNSYENQSFLGNASLHIKPAGFLWDERAMDIHTQSILAFTDEVEMGMTNMQEVVERVREQPYYQVLFKKAFRNDFIEDWQVLNSIKTFVNTLAATHSRFDEGLNRAGKPAQPFDNFSRAENLGKQLYLENCSSCHGTHMIGLSENLANNGLELSYEDTGRERFSKLPQDRDVFKVPMLRNVALTAPYMHDGRFATLEEVIEHYSTGIQAHPNLHHNLRHTLYDGQPRRFNFSAEEKQALIAFLHTLTDEKLVKDERFSNPFK